MNLKETIKEIDKVLINRITADELHPVNAFGLAAFYYDGDKRYPGLLSVTGEVKNCFLHDNYNLSWYHRNELSRFRIIENSYGDNLDMVEETIATNLIVNTNTNKTKRTLNEIKDIFVAALPSTLPKSIREGLNLFSVTIEIGEALMNSNAVFREECSIPEVRVGNEHGLIAIRYEIKQTYRRGCIPLCDC
jgi:hypothetical protein